MTNNKQESFDQLAQSLRSMNDAFQKSVASAINKHVTCRNWLNGYYIVQYEQNGSDRAKYAVVYSYVIQNSKISQSVIGRLEQVANQTKGIGQSLIAQLGSNEIMQSQNAPSDVSLMVLSDILFNRLSYTHFVQLLPIEDPLERTFYEIECIKGVWSTRELKRQIDSGYFVRSGLSRDKKALQALANQGAVQQSLHETVKSPFVFEFLGIDAKDVVEESDLESALMDHLQDFMLELGTNSTIRTWPN